MPPVREEIGVTGCPCKPKSLNFPFLFDTPSTKKSSLFVPPLIADPIIGKKVSLIAFRQILPKFFACDGHLQLHNHNLAPWS